MYKLEVKVLLFFCRRIKRKFVFSSHKNAHQIVDGCDAIMESFK